MSESKLTKLEEMATRIACADVGSAVNSGWRIYELADSTRDTLASSSVALALKIITEAAKHEPSLVPSCTEGKDWHVQHLGGPESSLDTALPARTAAVPPLPPPLAEALRGITTASQPPLSTAAVPTAGEGAKT